MKYIGIRGEHPNDYLDVTTYQAYLDQVKDRFPPNALEYAAASWHYDYSDPRSIHDAHVERVEILEGRDSTDIGGRDVNIRVQVRAEIGGLLCHTTV
jgi:hypothetical protein